ncbi:MAG: hypothetical protein KKF50_05375 [Nanoarchaeota archaeon]|nr:hypothetical protein [Nanoarchaeota archaeon]
MNIRRFHGTTDKSPRFFRVGGINYLATIENETNTGNVPIAFETAKMLAKIMIETTLMEYDQQFTITVESD